MNYTVTVEHTTQAGLAYTVHARNLLEAAFLAGRVSIPDGYTLVDVVAERAETPVNTARTPAQSPSQSVTSSSA